MPEPSSHPIHSPHDKFFKEAFSHPEIAFDVFQTTLPQRLVQEAEWTAMSLRPGSFVDEHLAETSADLLGRKAGLANFRRCCGTCFRRRPVRTRHSSNWLL